MSQPLFQDYRKITARPSWIDIAETWRSRLGRTPWLPGARQYVYNLSMECVNEGGGTVVINGGTVAATGNNYGIEAGDGSVTINGGTVTATGADGIYARCGIALGWTNPADSITASSFSSGDGVSVKAGQTFADERQNLYEGTLDATDRLYECWLLNLNFKVQDAGATLNSSVTVKFFKAAIEVPIPYDPEDP